MPPLPSIDTLRCFVAAARLLNFRAAARAVSLTPAALGQRIRQLEDACERPLFSRTTRKVVLTEAGLALLPQAEACLERALDCVRAGRGETGPPPMDVTIGTRHELGMSWVVPQLERIEARFPSVDFHLYFGSGPDLLLRVRTMEVDCAITSTRFSDPKLDSVRLHREDYAFVASPDLLRHLPLSKEEHARAHTLLDTSPELPLFRYFRDAPSGGDRLRFGKVVRLGSIAPIRARVLAGAGVAVLPAYQVRRDLEKGALRRVFPKVTLLHDYFRLVFRQADPRRAVFERLAEALVEAPLR